MVLGIVPHSPPFHRRSRSRSRQLGQSERKRYKGQHLKLLVDLTAERGGICAGLRSVAVTASEPPTMDLSVQDVRLAALVCPFPSRFLLATWTKSLASLARFHGLHRLANRQTCDGKHNSTDVRQTHLR